MTNKLWVEKYRPQVIDKYIGNEEVKTKFSQYIKDKDIPHILLYGRAGTGKTSLAKILYKNIDCTHLYINASDENGIEAVRTKIKKFASVSSFKPIKIIVLDEADRLTPEAQDSLRNVIETFHEKTRFILTCNHVDKLTEPLKSRMQSFKIEVMPKQDIASHVFDILDTEGIEYEDKDVATVINIYYPDIRKVINTLEQYSHEGKLNISSLHNKFDVDDIIKILQSNDSKYNKLKILRQYIADNNITDFTFIYTLLYDKVEYINKNNIGLVCILLAKYQHMDVTIPDRELNIMALFSEIIELNN